MQRMLFIALALFVVASLGSAPAQGRAGKKPKGAPSTKSAIAGTGIDETAVDPAVNPCDDFYQYACGQWIQRTQVPPDRPAWIRSFNEIQQRNEDQLHALLDAAAKSRSFSPDPYGDKVGDYYASCMDEARIESTADADLKALLAPIDAIANQTQLVKELAALHLDGTRALFVVGSEQDFKDATQMIARVDQSGLGLPDRDYYLKDDPKMKQIRAAYLEHVKKMLELAGIPDAAKKAATVMEIEHKLAEASMPRVDRRDPKKVYHRLELAGLIKTAPAFPWKIYFADLGFPEFNAINVAVPGFFAGLNELLQKSSLDDLKTYLRWHTIRTSARFLSKKLVDENFAFYEKTLSGTEQLPPRWKRCVRSTDGALGMALARPFVRKTFGAEGKATTLDMVHDVEAAMHADLDSLGWMDEPTRKAALEKLAAIANKIGYPDNWRNYDALAISRDSYLANARAATAFEMRRDLTKVGKPVDRTEWQMTPPTVNAYYEPSMNEMVFPAGILQSPFYSNSARPAVNYGAIGLVMGHELTHGFDDEGRQFDAHGNLHDWWTPSVGKEFDQRAACVVKQYDDYVAIDDVHVNGKLTLGENLADLGGVKLAHAAWIAAHRAAPPSKSKFTDDQLFYLGFAQSWCAKRKPEYARLRAATDPHSPPEWRVNGPLSNSSEFAAAFQCKAGDKMVRKDQCSVW
jgi:putative endopeptidase